jgi:hypothetical protein
MTKMFSSSSVVVAGSLLGILMGMNTLLKKRI